MEVVMAKDLMRAKVVKEARVARAWPQQQLATISGVTLRTIQRLEKDGAASFETLRGVAQAFEMDVKELNPSSVSSRNREKTKSDKKVHLLPRLLTGRSVTELVDSTDQYQIVHDEANDEKTVQIMRSILVDVQRNMVMLHDAHDAVEKLEIEFHFSRAIQEMEKLGFYLFGIKRFLHRAVDKKSSDISMCTLFMTYSNSPKIVRDKKLNMVVPALLTEVVK